MQFNTAKSGNIETYSLLPGKHWQEFIPPTESLLGLEQFLMLFQTS